MQVCYTLNIKTGRGSQEKENKKMKIVVKKENAEKIQKAIDVAEGKARERKITAEDLIASAEKLSKKLGIAPAHLRGVRAKVDLNAQDFPRAYKYIPESTIAFLEHTGRAWALVDVRRDNAEIANRAVRFTLTDEAREWILKRFEYMTDMEAL